jgi:hypothetical protein
MYSHSTGPASNFTLNKFIEEYKDTRIIPIVIQFASSMAEEGLGN